MFNKSTHVLFALFLSTCPVLAQVYPTSGGDIRETIRQAEQWIDIGSYHTARVELERLLNKPSSADERSRILFLLMNAAFSDQDFERSFQYSQEFLTSNQTGDRSNSAIYCSGVSAYHIGRYEIALQSLNTYLQNVPQSSARGIALYWRGLCRLQQNQFSESENDFQECLQDSSSSEFHDEVLMGLSLLAERQGDAIREAKYLDQLITLYPASNLATDARIRLAGLSIRRGDFMQGLTLLENVKPKYQSQREQLLLLRADAEYRSGSYERAAADYAAYLKQFPESPASRAARFGMAWAHLKRGDTGNAQREFQSLSSGNDSLASGSLYQLGILALLNGKGADALRSFDTLTTRFPYDTFADQSYFQMGMIQYRSQKYKDARTNFQIVEQLYPDSKLRSEALHMFGECNIALGDFSNAQHAFGQTRRLGASSDILAASILQEGISLYHLGRFKSSAARIDEYIRKFPNDPRIPEAYVWNGEALFQDDRFDEAARSFSMALRLLPKNSKRSDPAYGLAWSLFEQKKFQEAADAFDRFSTDYPESERASDAMLRKADCYFFLGRYDKASALYSALSSSAKSSRQTEYAGFQLAMSYIQRGETARGIDQLRNFVQRYPSSIYSEVARFNIGWTYFSREQYTDALPEFQSFLRQYPVSQLMPRVLFNTGDAFYNLKNYDSARVYYQRVIEEYPSSPLAADALTGLQFTYQAEGRSSEALNVLETFMNKKPDGIPQEELLMKKGDILFGQGDFSGAINEYQHVLNMNPGRSFQANALKQLARSYELQNNIERSNSYNRKIVDEFSDTEIAPAASLALGMGLIKTKQYTESVNALRDFPTRFPDSPLKTEAAYQTGIAMMNIPDQIAAREQFQTVIQTSPEHLFADKARLQIARIHLQRKEYSVSMDTLNALVERRNDDLAAEGLNMIAENYRALKRYKDALQAYNDVIQQYKEYSVQVERARFGTGETYEQMRDKKQARAAYNEIIKSPVDPEVRKEAEQRLKKLRR